MRQGQLSISFYRISVFSNVQCFA